MNIPTRLAWACVVAVLALQILWQWRWPSAGLDSTAGWILNALPWTPLLLAGLLRARHALIYAGIPMLFWFCHGVMEAWVDPDQRWLGVIEALLCAGYFGGLAWRRKLARRAQGPGLRAQ